MGEYLLWSYFLVVLRKNISGRGRRQLWKDWRINIYTN